MKLKEMQKMNKWKLIWLLFKKIIIEDRVIGTIVQMNPFREENIVFRKRK